MSKDRGGRLDRVPEWLPPLILVSAVSLYILAGDIA